MMEDIQRLVEQVHNSPPVVVVAVTGAGAQALAWLLAVPGASRTLLEATVPYGQRSMVELLGHEPDQYVSRETAVEMARAAYLRGLRLREDITPVVGLACTASIATDRLKRGEHRCSVAAWCESGAISYDLKLAKGERDRPGEEALVSRLVLHTLGLACGVEPELSLGLKDTERLEMRQTDHYTPIRRLLSRRENEGSEGSEAGTVIVQPDSRTGENEPVHGGVLPGSFSPLHHGHEQLAKLVSEELGAPVTFELSVVNVDKPTLTEEQLRRRLRQFQGRWSVALTRAPRFRQKAALFPGCTFVIGWDTAVRLADPGYYDGRLETVREALAEMRSHGCRYLVAGRVNEGRFMTLDDLPLPKGFEDMFEPISMDRFRADVSSTELRESGQEV